VSLFCVFKEAQFFQKVALFPFSGKEVPNLVDPLDQWRTQEFFSGGVQQIQLRTEDREDGDLGAVAP